MADNTVLNVGTGGDTIATDDIGGVKYQRVKPAFGADGSASDVSSSNPLPTAVRGSSDYAGADLVEAVVNGDLALHTSEINTERRDINGAQVVSDAPQTVQIVASTVGQQFLIDTQGYQSLCLTMGTMAASVAGNNDARGTFGAISAFPVVLGAPVTTAAASTNYVIPCLTRYIKLTVTTLGWATYTLRSVPVPVPYLANTPINLAQYLGATASSTNPVHVTPLALAATNNQSLNTFNLVTALAPAGAVIKASAGRLTSLNIMNGGTVAGFLHLCNSATCTPGTTATTFIYAVPGAVANYPINLPDGGLYLSTGISYYFSAGAASTDNTSFGSAPSLALNASYI